MERETPLYDGECVVIEETKTAEEMLKYCDKIYRKRENKKKCEWEYGMETRVKKASVDGI